MLWFLAACLSAAAHGAEAPRDPDGGDAGTVARAALPRPLQPLTVELLDLWRGRWRFVDALGQYLALDEPAPAVAFVGETRGPLRLAALCCDPEFPDDPAHADLRVLEPVRADEAGTWFRLAEPYFTADIVVGAPQDGKRDCALHNVALGPATTGDRYVSAICVLADDRACPLWLLPRGDGAPVRLLTDRVGHVFCGSEPVRVRLVGLDGNAARRRFDLRATDLATGEAVWAGHTTLVGSRGHAAVQEFVVPLSRYGLLELKARRGSARASLRLCRLPDPRSVDPDASAIGMNIFQQQIWWYAYQVPLLARAGVHWVRPWLAWENTWATQQPAPDQWDTRALHAALRRMEAHDLRYQDILFAAPQWAAEQPGWVAPPVERMDVWAAYVKRLVTEFRGQIRYWEIWNEPDLMWPEATRHSGEHYVALLKTAYEAAKAADPDCVVLGLSHAGYEEWLDRVGALGAAQWLDGVTIHTYAQPADFIAQVARRREILARHGLDRKPLWINELGTTAYDLNPAYNAEYGCSERRQAAVLTEDYALALSCDPAMKAYWFCTYDPRDAAHRSGWTGDAGIGVLYLGFLPKLAYAALAGVAHELDGRRCLGRGVAWVGRPGRPDGQAGRLSYAVRFVAFEGPVAVVWSDDPAEAGQVLATEVGCWPGERITVRDQFTNPLAAGRPDRVRLDLGRGPLYVEGSAELAGIAQAESAVTLDRQQLVLEPGAIASVSVSAPREAAVAAEGPPGLSTRVGPPPTGSEATRTVSVAADAATDRASGLLQVRVTLPPGTFGLRAPHEVVRTLPVSVGPPNLLRDGGFGAGNLLAWGPERTSAYAWDANVGHDAPGSLRLDAPFDRRLVHWGLAPAPGKSLRLRAWVRTDDLGAANVTLSLALFGPSRWLSTWCLATTGPEGEIEGGWRTVPGCGHIPAGTSDWTLVEAMLPGDVVPAETTAAAFFVDAKGAGPGTIWFDDLDLWEAG